MFPFQLGEAAQSLNHLNNNNKLDEQAERKLGMSMVSADMGLVSMVRQGILALQLLPPNSSAGRLELRTKKQKSDLFSTLTDLICQF